MTADDAEKRIAQGVNAWEREDYEEAVAIFDEVLLEHPTYPDVHNWRGLCLAMLGKLDAGLSALDRALELAPEYVEAHVNRGIVLKDLDRRDEAQAAFDRAVELDRRHGYAFPSHVGNQIAVTHAKLGDLYRTADRADRAAEQYRAALAVRPRFLDVRTKLAEALMELGQVREAQEELEFVLDRDPDFTGARVRLGVALRRQGLTQDARREWSRCVQEDPDDFRARAYLASLDEELKAPETDGGEDER